MNLLRKLYKKKKNMRTVVIGLDGVPYTMLKDMADRQIIPKMKSLFDNGYIGPLEVTIPEISSVSWSSFMTGEQAGKHGIFGFIDIAPESFNLYFPNFSNLKCIPFWNAPDLVQKKAVVINMPATYPAQEINGALISGFVAIDLASAVYPKSLLPKLHEIGYRIDLDLNKCRHDHDYLFEDLKLTLKKRELAIDYLWKEIDWNLFMVVITGTDRLMHFLWDAYGNESHIYHQDFIDYFKEIDALVGRIYDRFSNLSGDGAPNRFYMLSDHGFTKIEYEVYLNQFLKNCGYLTFKQQRPDTIMEIGEGAKAFALDPSRVYINLKGKYPAGTVDQADLFTVREEIKSALEGLVSPSGDPIIKRIYRKEELYHGQCLNQAPDLVILSKHGYDLKGKVNGTEVFGHSGLQGMHTQNDAFFFSETGVACQKIFNVKNAIIESFQGN